MTITQPRAVASEVIPVIDLAAHLRGDEAATVECARQVRDALQQVGFFFIVNHGVDWSLVEDVYEQARRFHALDDDTKNALKMSEHNTGYVGFLQGRSNASKLDTAKKPNLNAAFFMKRDLPDGHPAARNQWPPEAAIPGYRAALVRWFDTMEAFGKRMLALYALALDLPADFFDEMFVDGEITQRLSHYPAVDPDVDQWGLAPHTDGGFMTLLVANDVPGLWIRPDGHDWMAAPAIDRSFLVNSGDMLRRWTNDRFLSTEHRVLNESGTDRYAIPFFHSPHRDTVVECLPTCCGPDDPPRYPPVVYGEYLRWFMSRNYHGNDDPAAP